MIPASELGRAEKSRGSGHRSFGQWHGDRLVSSIMLASSFGAKSLNKLLKKAGHSGFTGQAGEDLWLEEALTACRVDQNARAAVEKALNSKFQSSLGRIRKLGEREILELADDAPWLVPLLWGCCQSPGPEAGRAGRRLAKRILLSGRIRPPATDEVEAARKQVEALAAQNAALRKELSELKDEHKKLGLDLQRLSAKDEAAAKPAQAPANPHKRQAKQLRRELAETGREMENLRQQVAVWRSLALRGEKNQNPAPAAVRRADGFPAPDACQGCKGEDKARCCRGTENCPLSGRKVAVIGGLERLEKGYAQLIEKMGGKCIFHPGHTASGMTRLRKMVSGSDLVVYLTPINSHGAMSVVKKQCKRCNTPFCPLNGTSVSALESHLSEMTDFF